MPEPGRNTRGTTQAAALTDLGLELPSSTLLPDVVLHDPTRHRLFLIDAALRTGGMDEPRRLDLAHAFAPTGLHVICITALPSRRYLPAFAARVAWDSEVWLAEEPGRLIHFKREGVLRLRGAKV